MHPRLASRLTFAALLLGPASALAQLNPNQPGGMPSPGQGEDEKPAGVAEQAPATPGILPTTPVLPPPRSQRKRFELFELDGYFRFRGDWFKKFHLGFDDEGDDGGAPFPRPLACHDGGEVDKPCEDTLKSANVRLRLEPTIRIDERAAVHLQVDVLDNVVLGSTPRGDAPRVLDDGQAPPVAGQNSNQDSIVVKRAWAEIDTALGEITFGRQPWAWGMGIYANAGGYDPVHATWDLDGDHGDTVDRVSFATEIPGTPLRAMLAMDWSQTTPSAAQSALFAERAGGGQPWDLDDNDDANQWTLLISRLDSPAVFKDKVDQGETALNYGVHLARRKQAWEQGGDVDLAGAPDATMFLPLSATLYLPDLWLRLARGRLSFEAEAIAVLGSIEDAPGRTEDISMRQFGAVGRFLVGLVGGDLRLGAEVGYASGDQWDNDQQGETHASNRSVLPQGDDTTASAFLFDPDYKIDLILFRELIGAVTNATYVRPSVAYDISDRFTASLATIVSFANVPVATPGNGSMYGVETDLDVGYHNEGFFAGIAYGVLFPLGALNHPEDVPGNGPGFGYGDNLGESGDGDAKAAQTIQLRMALQF